MLHYQICNNHAFNDTVIVLIKLVTVFFFFFKHSSRSVLTDYEDETTYLLTKSLVTRYCSHVDVFCVETSS